MSPHVKDGAFATGIFVGIAVASAGLWWLGNRLERWRMKRRRRHR